MQQQCITDYLRAKFDDPKCTPCHKLWLMVLLQAVMDAYSNVQRSEYIYHRNRARWYLTSATKDYMEVCDCAGLDWRFVRGCFVRLFGEVEEPAILPEYELPEFELTETGQWSFDAWLALDAPLNNTATA